MYNGTEEQAIEAMKHIPESVRLWIQHHLRNSAAAFAYAVDKIKLGMPFTAKQVDMVERGYKHLCEDINTLTER